MTPSDPLDHCATEPIHLLERVQSYGAMAVFERASGQPLASTANFAPTLGLQGRAHLLQEVLQVATASLSPRAREDLLGRPGRVDWGAVVGGAGLHFFRHTTPNEPALEVLEVVAETTGNDALDGEAVVAALARFSEQIQPMTSIADAMRYASDSMLGFLGYARVLVYRFDDAMNGEVIAESWGGCASEQKPLYLNLRFPASDIPPQARRLYEKNLVRIIADASDPGLSLDQASVGDVRPHEPIDLTHSLLRRPSDMHLQYLRNMGVAASVVTSLMVDGRLWGMIVCQHEEKRVPPHNTRAVAQGFCQVVSSIMSSKLRWLDSQAALQRRVEEARWLQELEGLLRQPTAADLPLAQVCEVVQRGTHADEVRLLCEGDHLAQATDALLLNQLLAIEPGRDHGLLAAEDLRGSPLLCSLAGTRDSHAGMAVYVAHGTPRLALVCYRNRRTTAVQWGGNPNDFEPTATSGGAQVLGPRRSFALWVEENHEVSEPWQPEETDFLERAGSMLGRALAENRLRAVQSEYEFVASLLPLMDDMIVAWRPAPETPDALPVFVNDSFRRKLNLAPENTRYSQWVPATMRLDAAIVRSGPQRAVSVAIERIDLLDVNGHPICVDCSFTLIPATENNGALVTCVLRDVTDTVDREHQLLEAKRTLESTVQRRTAKLSAAMRDLEGLSYAMAHDLRGPLRSINGFAALLLEELSKADNEQAFYAQKISDSSRLMGQIISDLLDLIRVVNEEPQFARVDLPTALAGLADSLVAGNPTIRIEFGPLPAVNGDARLLRQLFLNLFDNAIKYRKPDAGLRVTLGFDEPSGRFYVRDTGSGFDPASDGDPFQPFRRLKNASGVVGAGIGLTVVSRIVEKLHGQVSIESAPGEGTTVWLTMDLAEQAHTA